MILPSGTQVNTMTHLKVTNIHITDTKYAFVFDEVLKHSRPKYYQNPLIFTAYAEFPDLHPV